MHNYNISANITLFWSYDLLQDVMILFSEAVIQRSSVKKVFLKISQNSQKNTCAGVSFLMKFQAWGLAQVFSCEFSKISKNTFLHRTPLVAASVVSIFYQNDISLQSCRSFDHVLLSRKYRINQTTQGSLMVQAWKLKSYGQLFPLTKKGNLESYVC